MFIVSESRQCVKTNIYNHVGESETVRDRESVKNEKHQNSLSCWIKWAVKPHHEQTHYWARVCVCVCVWALLTHNTSWTNTQRSAHETTHDSLQQHQQLLTDQSAASSMTSAKRKPVNNSHPPHSKHDTQLCRSVCEKHLQILSWLGHLFNTVMSVETRVRVDSIMNVTRVKAQSLQWPALYKNPKSHYTFTTLNLQHCFHEISVSVCL